MWDESEEAAAMGNRVPCTTSPVPAQPQQMRVNYRPVTLGSPVPAQPPSVSQSQMGQQMRVKYRPVALGSPQPLPQVRGAGEAANQGTDSGQRKRGRPKKSMGTEQTPPQQLRGDASDSPTEKKPRGRPPGSSTKKKGIEALALALGSTGSGFRPHVITVETGEDVYSKVMASQQGPRAVCILSAHGALSNVTLAQPHQFGANSEGPYEILTLSGSFMPPHPDAGTRIGGLSVMLALSDGRVFGGRVAGLLTAASPVQVILGSFTLDDRKPPPKSPNTMEEETSSASPKLNMGSPSQGAFGKSPGGSAASPINLSSRNVRPVYGALSLPRKQ